MTDDHIPDYLVIGHVTKDNIPSGAILGGTPSYAGLTAHKLGKRTAIVTSFGPDVPLLTVLDGIDIHSFPGDATTTFENIYVGGAPNPHSRRVGHWSASVATTARWGKRVLR